MRQLLLSPRDRDFGKLGDALGSVCCLIWAGLIGLIRGQAQQLVSAISRLRRFSIADLMKLIFWSSIYIFIFLLHPSWEVLLGAAILIAIYNVVVRERAE
jgi:hypothetical protein